METRIKRILSCLLAAVMLLQCVPARAAAASVGADLSAPQQDAAPAVPEVQPEPEPPAESQPRLEPAAELDNLSWTVNDGILTISGTGDMPDWGYSDAAPWDEYQSEITAVVIEEGVTGVGKYSFVSYPLLTSVTLPAGLLRINAGAFYKCAALKEVSLSDGLTAIGNSAFYNCAALETITLPDSVTTLGDYAFDGCSSLQEVTLSEELTYIGSYAFRYCSALEAVTIPDAVTTIEASTFYECDALRTVLLPQGLTSIRSNAFTRCDALESIVIPDQVTSIGSYAFESCTALKEVILPQNLDYIGGYAFRRCTALTEIALPQGLTKIDTYAFSDCTGLEEVVIPDSVKTLGSYAFQYCSALRSAELPTSLTQIDVQTFGYCSALESITIPESVTYIGTGAFSNCTSLRSVDVPDTITYLGNYAFKDCKALKEARLSEGLTSLSSGVFSGCAALESISIPETITRINAYAFEYCTALTSVTIPASVATLSSSAFSHCTGLQEVCLSEGLTTISDHVFYGCSSLEEIVIPAGVKSIGSYAFENCTALKTVTLPEGLSSMGEFAFRYCAALEHITLPDTLTSIEKQVFFECTSLKEIVIPEGVTVIGANAFSGCTSLASVTLPESLTEIRMWAFNYCVMEEVYLSENIKTYGEGVFSNCRNLKSLKLAEGVTAIPEYFACGCHSLESCNIPSTVTTIGQLAFFEAYELREFILPAGLTSVGKAALGQCRNVTELTIPGSLTTLTDSFSDVPGLKKVVIEEGVTTINAWALANNPSMEQVWVPASVQSMDSTTFSGSPNTVIYGIPGTYAETYAAEHYIPFVNALNPGIWLSVTVTDEAGDPVDGAYEIAWYVQGQTECVSTENRILVSDLSKGYSYQVTLGDELSYQYVPPVRQSVDAETDGALTLALEPIPTVVISGRVTDQAGSPLAAGITLKQIYNSRYTREEAFRTNADGTFSLQVDNVPADAVFTGPEGYYVSNKTLLSAPAEGGAVDAGTILLYPLPAGNRIDLTLWKLPAVKSGLTARTEPYTDAANLQFRIYNKTRATWLDTPVLQNGALYISGAFRAGDTLTISAADRSGRYTCPDVEVQLDAQCTAAAELTLTENGSIRVGAISGTEQTRVMLFDAQGRNLDAQTVDTGYASAPLAAGDYSLVLMEHNAFVTSVDNLTLLDQLGLVKFEDYRLYSVSVKNGVIRELSSVSVPELDISRLCHTIEDQTYVTVDRASVAQGQHVLVRVRYELERDYGESVSDETVLIDLPEGLKLADGALSVNGQAAQYTLSGSRITVHTGHDSATVCFYVLAEDPGVQNIAVSLRADGDGVTRTEPLGTGTLTVSAAQVSVVERTAREWAYVSGKAYAGSTVRVYEGNALLGETVANAAGNWRISCELTNYLNYQVHHIYAVIENDVFDHAIVTETSTVVYDSNYVDVRRVTMYNTAENIERVSIFDYVDTQQNPYYYVQPDVHPNFTFVIEFDGDASRVENVELTVYTRSGAAEVLDAYYSYAQDAWIAVGQFRNFADVPVNVGVGYDCGLDADYGTGLTEAGGKAVEEFYDAFEDFYGSLISFGEPEQSGSDLVIPMQIQESPFGTQNITISEADYGSFDLNDMESQGFTQVDASVAEMPMYIRMEEAGGDLVLWCVDTATQTACTITMPMELMDPDQGMAAAQSAGGIMPCAFTFGPSRPILDWVEKWPISILPGYIALLDLTYQYEILDQLSREFHQRSKNLYDLLQAVCPDGTPLVDNRDGLFGALERLEQQQFDVFRQMSDELDAYGARIRNNFILDGVTMGLGKLFKLLDTDFGKFGDKALDWFERINDLYGFCEDVSEKKDALMKLYGDTFDLDGSPIYLDMLQRYEDLMDQLDSLFDSAANQDADQKCKKPKKKEKKTPTDDKTPFLDPAGFVYEAVESNRLEGATVTVYYQADENQGPSSATIWDAESYDQQNPQITDANGQYAWYVPFGQWQVKCELEGYETAWSEWLPVPPPQLEVNIGMISTAAPEVLSAACYDEGVILVFSQYMDIESVRAAAALECGGQSLPVSLEPMDAEYDPAGVHPYATRFLLTAGTELTGRTVRVKVDRTAKNYAGTALESAYDSGSLTCVVQPTGISMREEYSVVTGEAVNVNVTLLPGAADRQLLVRTGNASMLALSADSLTTDADGCATLQVEGLLPGVGYITVSDPVSGLEYTAKVHVRGSEPDPVGAVTVTLENGDPVAAQQTVVLGTKLLLTTDTEGAEIRYTTDGSCPCRNEAQIYTEPLVITEDTTLQAAAVKDGVFGPISEYKLTVKAPFTDVKEGAFYYKPVLWAVQNGITSGVTDTTFAPNNECTRGQVVTFLWRAAGCPEPKSTRHPFTDVKETAYYYKAMLWAVENGITNGVTATTFGPGKPCDRGTVVTFLWRAKGKPEPGSAEHPFTDVKEGKFYYKAMLWAVEKGITSGTTKTTFAPSRTCTRGQVVTFLYRAFTP